MNLKNVAGFMSIFLLNSLVIYCESLEDVIVETQNGKIRGLITHTRKGREVFTFYGVRFAEPPIGELRFKPPEALRTKWQGVYNATENGQACMQNNPLPITTQSEDCLFLDVYSSDLHGFKPVIVFIHGGTFINGSKIKASYEYLLDKDVVLVSINYRLDAFGFFSTGTKYASGNQGFKDQNMALQWVRDNINVFGGNPDLVTLSGQSAGAMSVTLHMLSPMSRGLFHRAIAMSGAAVGYIESKNRNTSRILLEKTNCNKSDALAAVECLRNLPAETILSITSRFSPIFPWNYDIEAETVEQPFITELPADLAQKGHIQKVPLMIGVTLDELYGDVYTIVRTQRREVFLLNHFFVRELPNILMYPNAPNRTEISKKLDSIYMRDMPITTRNDRNLGKLFSDGILEHGVHRMMEYTRRSSNVFYYRMDYQGRYSVQYSFDGKLLGVLHEDDLQYVLVFKEIAPVMNVTDPENRIIERMTSWWAKFAETGNPNDASNKWTNAIYWTPCSKNRVHSLYLNENYRVGTEFNKDRFALWDSLFPLY